MWGSICSCCFRRFPTATQASSDTKPAFALRCSLSVLYCGQCADLFCAAHFRGFPLEIRALGWTAAYGAVATFVSELVKLPAVRPIWTDFLENWLPFSVVFFLWCLYFSTKQRPQPG